MLVIEGGVAWIVAESGPRRVERVAADDDHCEFTRRVHDMVYPPVGCGGRRHTIINGAFEHLGDILDRWRLDEARCRLEERLFFDDNVAEAKVRVENRAALKLKAETIVHILDLATCSGNLDEIHADEAAKGWHVLSSGANKRTGARLLNVTPLEERRQKLDARLLNGRRIVSETDHVIVEKGCRAAIASYC